MATNDATSGDEPKYRNEEWLREQYVELEQSTYDISEKLGCDRATICNWLKRHDINTRQGNKKPTKRLTNEEWLREQYVELEQSTYDISEKCDCSRPTVCNWLRKHDISIRKGVEGGTPPENGYIPPSPYPRLQNEDWLKEQYLTKDKSVYDIAKMCGCSYQTVYKWLHKNGIELKDYSGEEHHMWKDGVYSYGAGWNKRKKRVIRERDNHTCKNPNCSMTQKEHIEKYGEKLHVHHLRKARNVNDPEERNAKENLITLCRDCHYQWERISNAGIVPQIESVNA